MRDELEIEMTTSLRGPLAERLVALAKARHCAPVEQMADVIERALKEECRFDDNAALVKRLRKENDTLRRLHQEVVASRPSAIAYLPKVQDALVAEARRRNLSFDLLIYEIVKTVAADNLFAAVLDAD